MATSAQGRDSMPSTVPTAKLPSLRSTSLSSQVRARGSGSCDSSPMVDAWKGAGLASSACQTCASLATGWAAPSWVLAAVPAENVMPATRRRPCASAVREAGVTGGLRARAWFAPSGSASKGCPGRARAQPDRARDYSPSSKTSCTVGAPYSTAPVRTFLDEAIEKGENSHGALGFGSAIHKALATRRNWLLAQGLARDMKLNQQKPFVDWAVKNAKVMGLE